ncbi:hypothetical protein K0M31_004443 [Melipona bicolor]|uniref:Uncharacterized protein n=1 Tax=Melipona bicolor TaxID=60889 RepID=A0AA40FXS5_9HYME|nr:hypothetical protein K0M31_004443 [Melipona bicolor]
MTFTIDQIPRRKSSDSAKSYENKDEQQEKTSGGKFQKKKCTEESERERETGVALKKRSKTATPKGEAATTKKGVKRSKGKKFCLKQESQPENAEQVT